MNICRFSVFFKSKLNAFGFYTACSTKQDVWGVWALGIALINQENNHQTFMFRKNMLQAKRLQIWSLQRIHQNDCAASFLNGETVCLWWGLKLNILMLNLCCFYILLDENGVCSWNKMVSCKKYWKQLTSGSTILKIMFKSGFKSNWNFIWLKHPCHCPLRAVGHACLHKPISTISMTAIVVVVKADDYSVRAHKSDLVTCLLHRGHSLHSLYLWLSDFEISF